MTESVPSNSDGCQSSLKEKRFKKPPNTDCLYTYGYIIAIKVGDEEFVAAGVWFVCILCLPPRAENAFQGNLKMLIFGNIQLSHSS